VLVTRPGTFGTGIKDGLLCGLKVNINNKDDMCKFYRMSDSVEQAI